MNLTKREQFAGMAMQGVLAATNQDDCHPHCVASWAVELTDALIAELDRTAPKCPKCEGGGTGPLCGRHVSYGSTTEKSPVVEHHFPDAKEMVPDEDGWIPHNPGDPMPCDGAMLVEIQARDGYRDTLAASNFGRGNTDMPDWWSGDCKSGDEVIKWRPAR